MPADLDSRVTFTCQEVATALGVTDETIRRWCDSGELAAIRIRGRVLVLAQPIVNRVLASLGDKETLDKQRADSENEAFNTARNDAARNDPERYWAEFATAAEREAYRAEVEREREKSRQAGNAEIIYA